ncbi:hypothetical protein [Candidatus Pelagibacter communis]|uniref:hypothetical protein n=1 Tax=Pelagibacter ubique TaxID=198252 RepID=UPI00094C47D8|nr:hypothetical protein [Candidatus Pelagibacter ubique]
MEIIVHRINQIKKLQKIPQIYGAEVDLRSRGSNIILNHEPHQNGDKFENFLENYKHGTLILNIKESGIEDEVLKLVKAKKLNSFFLLDIEIPYLFQCLKKKNRNCALRLSHYEPLYAYMEFKKIFNWFWIDSIKKINFTNNDIKILNKNKTCFVCPERWGKPQLINYYKNYFKKKKLKISSVMTSLKYVDKWIS